MKRGIVIVREAPSELFGALSDIVVRLASTTSPLAAASVRGGLRVRRAATRNGCSNVGNGHTGRRDLCNPLLHFGGVLSNVG